MKTNKYWFIPKIYGYGYVPITWEGWLVVLFILGVITLCSYTNNFFRNNGPDIKEVIRYILELILLIFAINPFMKSKTKGEVKWSWGNK
jgi:asparagine N-glycosylation enzyme membrane subunit Stt3